MLAIDVKAAVTQLFFLFKCKNQNEMKGNYENLSKC